MVELPEDGPRNIWLARDWLIIGVIGFVALLAWGATVMMADRSMVSMPLMGRDAPMADMPGMAMAPTPSASPSYLVSLPAVLLFLTMWVVMMVAMMFPSIWPVVVLHHRTATRAGWGGRSSAGRRAAATGLFLLGYLMVWGGSGLVALAGQVGAPVGLAWSGISPEWSWRLGGLIFVLAGLYQFTPLKERCLTHCQSPLGFIMHHWREGWSGAVRMGMTHGLYCLGCCWALMAILVTVGMMHLAWMAGLAGLILLEKLGRWGILVPRVSGLLLMGTGLAILMQPAIFLWLSR